MNDRWKPILSTVAVFCIALPHARSQSGPPEKPSPGAEGFQEISCRGVVAAGGIAATNGILLVNGTLAQTVIGGLAARPISGGQGFWYLLPQTTGTSTEVSIVGETSTELALHAFPNSFSQSTRIVLYIPETRHVSLILYDLLGKPLRILFDEEQPEGDLSFTLAADELPSGDYRLRATDGVRQRTIPIRIVR